MLRKTLKTDKDDHETRNVPSRHAPSMIRACTRRE